MKNLATNEPGFIGTLTPGDNYLTFVAPDTITLPWTIPPYPGDDYVLVEKGEGEYEWSPLVANEPTELGEITADSETWITVEYGTVTWPPVNTDVIITGKQIIMEGQVIFNQQPIFLQGGQPMFTLSSVLIIMVICIITVKWVMPLLTLRRMAKALVRLVLKPFQKAGKKVETEIDKAAAVVGEEWRAAGDDKEPSA